MSKNGLGLKYAKLLSNFQNIRISSGLHKLKFLVIKL